MYADSWPRSQNGNLGLVLKVTTKRTKSRREGKAIVAWARKFRGVIKRSITSGCSMTGLASEQGTTNPREGTTGVDFEARSNMREKTRYHTIAGTLVAWVIACAMSYSPPVQAQSGVPKYEVDPFWAKL